MDGWSDRLLSFNDEQCEYDSIGNPILYRGKTLTWQYGRQLATFDNVAYNYYSDGLRRQKSVNGISTDYIWSDKRLVAENKVAKNLLFKYGISGILGFSYDSKEYTYRKNLQGDITDIIDENNIIVAHYDYDAYGNQRIYGYHDNEWKLLEDTLTHEGIYSNTAPPMQLPYLLSDKDILKSNHIAYINPFRYRSYYYDTETNLYYLTTRYYDPETGRFINADDISYADPETINGLNLFSYCLNNPIMHTDNTGTSPWYNTWWGKALIGLGIVIGTALFVAAIVASAGTVGALAGLGAAGLGFSATTVSTIATIGTIGTYVIAGGVGLFGLSDAIEVWSGGTNPIRDWVMGGNQTAYGITNGVFSALGTLAVLAGIVGTKIIKNIKPNINFSGRNTPMKGQNGRLTNVRGDGYQMNFYDKKGNWNLRIDSYTQLNHTNPHIHFGNPGSLGNMMGLFWQIKKWFGIF